MHATDALLGCVWHRHVLQLMAIHVCYINDLEQQQQQCSHHHVGTLLQAKQRCLDITEASLYLTWVQYLDVETVRAPQDPQRALHCAAADIEV